MRSMKANKSSWKNEAMGSAKESIPFDGFYTDAEAQAICCGLIPESMDDKWLVYSENGWVYFHRSWSGQCIFMLKLDGSPAGVRVVETWVSRDSKNYKSPGVDSEIKLISGLIEKLISAES